MCCFNSLMDHLAWPGVSACVDGIDRLNLHRSDSWSSLNTLRTLHTSAFSSQQIHLLGAGGTSHLSLPSLLILCDRWKSYSPLLTQASLHDFTTKFFLNYRIHEASLRAETRLALPDYASLVKPVIAPQLAALGKSHSQQNPFPKTEARKPKKIKLYQSERRKGETLGVRIAAKGPQSSDISQDTSVFSQKTGTSRSGPTSQGSNHGSQKETSIRKDQQPVGPTPARKQQAKRKPKATQTPKEILPCPFATRYAIRYSHLHGHKKECISHLGIKPSYMTEHLKRNHTLKKRCHIDGCKHAFACVRDSGEAADHHKDCRREDLGEDGCVEDEYSRRWDAWQVHSVAHGVEVHFQYPHMMSPEQERKLGPDRVQNLPREDKWKCINELLFPLAKKIPDPIPYTIVNPAFQYQELEDDQRKDIRSYKDTGRPVHAIWNSMVLDLPIANDTMDTDNTHDREQDSPGSQVGPLANSASMGFRNTGFSNTEFSMPGSSHQHAVQQTRVQSPGLTSHILKSIAQGRSRRKGISEADALAMRFQKPTGDDEAGSTEQMDIDSDKGPSPSSLITREGGIEREDSDEDIEEEECDNPSCPCHFVRGWEDHV